MKEHSFYFAFELFVTTADLPAIRAARANNVTVISVAEQVTYTKVVGFSSMN